MNLPDGTYLGYIVAHEAWYGKSAHIDLPELQIRACHLGDGPGGWEFLIRDFGAGKGPLVEMFPDSWAAYAQIPEFFEALAATTQEESTLETVRAILDGLGAIDETDRERPPYRNYRSRMHYG